MTQARFDLAIVIKLGSYQRAIPAAALAAVLHISPLELRSALLGLLRAAHGSTSSSVLSEGLGEATEGGRSETNVRPSSEAESSGTDVPTGASPRTETLPSDDDACAQALALALDDVKGITSLRVLVARHPRSVLERALAQTLRVPRERITRSRAAYFTTLVHVLAAHSSTPSFYASPPPSVAP